MEKITRARQGNSSDKRRRQKRDDEEQREDWEMMMRESWDRKTGAKKDEETKRRRGKINEMKGCYSTLLYVVIKPFFFSLLFSSSCSLYSAHSCSDSRERELLDRSVRLKIIINKSTRCLSLFSCSLCWSLSFHLELLHHPFTLLVPLHFLSFSLSPPPLLILKDCPVFAEMKMNKTREKKGSASNANANY